MVKPLFRFVTALAAVVLFLSLLDWWDGYHLLIAALAGLTVIAARLALKKRAGRTSGHRRYLVGRPEHPLRTVFLALCIGAVCVGLLGGATFVCDRVPGLKSLFLDTDRTTVEQTLAVLENAGNYAEAAKVIESRLGKRITARWARELRQRLYLDLVRASGKCPDDEARAFLEKAVDLAKANELDPTSAEALLKRLDLEARIAASEKLSEGQSASWARRQFELLLAWGDSSSDFSERRRCYLSAKSLAGKYGIPTDSVDEKLKHLEADVLAARPAKLPTGTVGTIERVSFDGFPPVIAVDLSLKTASGSHVSGLVAKDFEVTVGSKKAGPLYVSTVRPSAKLLQIVLLLDKSASTAGAPAESAKAGTGVLLDRLQGAARVKAFTFGDAVTPLCNWTESFASVKAAIAPVKAEGRTALFAALDIAAQAFEGQAEPKSIVLFTDGKDTVGGPPVNDLIARCRRQHISVNVVALATPELDQQGLSFLTEQTGGQLVTASRETELIQRFEQVAVSLRRPRYRLVIPWTGDTAALRIRVGGTSGITLEAVPTVAARK